MIVSKLISGLGNQLFQYALGRQISLLNNVNLKIDSSFFTIQNLRSFKLEHYNINAEIASDDDINELLYIYKSNTLGSKVTRKIESFMPKYKKRFFKEDEWWIYEPEVFKVSSNVYLEGYWQHYKYFENINPLILDELTIQEVYTGNALTWLTEIESQPAAVSVHIRRGDYVTDSTAFNLMGVLPLDYYHQAIIYITQQCPAACFYFFSDDLDWVKDNLRPTFPSRYVEMADGAKDYVELDLMSKCKHNIIANSSFSWWGAFLNRNADKIVIAPRKWVAAEEINSRIKLQLPSWIKL